MNSLKYSLVLSCLLLVGVAMPQQSAALSCIDPASSLNQYVESPEYIIFTAISGETVEHIKQAATTDGNLNFRFDSGYTGQSVQVSEVHKGVIEGSLWVYHKKNATWGYMCAGGPAEVGAATVYIVTPPQGLFDLPQVVNSFPVQSDAAKDLLASLSTAKDNGPTYVDITTDANWKQHLSSQIREMIFMIRIKFAEWKFWAAQ